jgi:hypothetical protein
MARPRALQQAIAWLSLVLVLGTVTSCSTPDAVSGPEQSASGASLLLGSGDGLLGTGLGATLLACPPQPEVRAQKNIGPQGGTIQIGPHTLVVPEGSLSTTVTIAAVAPSDPVVSVRFAPEGLRFARPARLTLSYAHCPVLPRLLPKRIAYTNELLAILELLVSVDDLFRHRVSAHLDHFSRYAVAW